MTIFSKIPAVVNKWKQDINPETSTVACVTGVQRRRREEKVLVNSTENLDKNSIKLLIRQFSQARKA